MSCHHIVTETALLENAGDTIHITGAQARHLAGSRRIRTGERAVIKDGKGLAFEAKVSSVQPEDVTFLLEGQIQCPDDTLPLVLLPAVIKGKRMDWLIQKACELGTSEIMPVITERTVARVEGRGRKFRRWQEIAVQALQQCSGNRLTRIHAPVRLQELLDNMSNISKIVLHKGADSLSFSEILHSEAWDQRRFAVAAGPEGGFTHDELAQLEAAGFMPATLGSRILRAETASIAAASVISAWRWVSG